MEDDPGEKLSYDDGRQTAQESVRPGFLSSTDKQKAEEAASSLGAAEKAASGADLSQKEDSLAGAKQAEDKTGFYSGEGKKSGKIKGKLGFKGRFMKTGPILGIFLTIFGIGGLMTGTQIFQPFSLVAQFQETFNSMHTSANMRSSRFFKAQMETGRTKNPIKGTIFGKTFKITDKQNEKLKTQGIEYDDSTFKDANGKAIKVLKFDDGTGEIRIVAADEKTAKKLTELGLSKFNTDDIKYNTEALSFKNLYSSNSDFFHGYNAGSMTWRGAIANWFGKNTVNFLQSNKLTRNMFQDYQEKVEAAEDGNTKKVAQDIMAERANKVEDGGVRITEKDTDEDGNDEFKTKPEESDTIDRTNLTKEDVRAKLDKISASFNQAANIGCAIVGAIGAINLLVQASEAIQIITLTTGYFETVDKTKYGLGEDAPIHDLTNALNERIENKHVSIVGEGNGTVTESGIEGMNTEESTTKKTAMEAAGVAALYSGGRVDPKDPSVSSFNFAASSKQILGGMSLSMDMFKSCTIAKAGAAAISMVVDGIEIAGCIAGLLGSVFTFGATATACGPLAASIAKNIALGVAIGVALGGLISLIVPKIANMMTRDLISELGGEDLGNALTSGANIYQGGAHRASGGSLSSIDKYKEFAVAQKQVVAENAKYERESLSPFDITSKNTFLGTILTQMMSFTHANTLMSTVTAGNSAVSSSLIAMTPTASAYDLAEYLPDDIDEYEDTCPYLASIGAIGDSFCNPYVMTDTDTIEDDPADVVDKVYNLGGLTDEETSDGNVVIDGKSDLAKYIRYCDNRSSAFGVADQNIAGEVGTFANVDTDSSTFNNAANAGIGNVPVIGDIVEIVQDTQQLNHIGYISGESCVAGNEVDAPSSPDWDKAQYYQRFIEDQSLAESMGIIEKSAVAAYMEDYYKEHPLDNSYEGLLARYSGLTKDNVVALLDIIEYYNFVANYDASDRYAFGAPAVELEDKKVEFNNENVLAGEVNLLGNIVYADVRNRSFAV